MIAANVRVAPWRRFAAALTPGNYKKRRDGGSRMAPPLRAVLTALLAAALLLPLAFSASTDLYAGWVYPGETFTVGGELYSVTKGSSPFEILLQRGAEKYVLTYGSCKMSQDGLLKLCYEESDYVDCDRGDYECPEEEGEPDDWCCPYDVTHLRYEAGTPIWGAYVTVNEVAPALTVTRVPAEKTLKLGDSTTVVVTIKNTGEDSLNGAVYKEYIPEGFTVTITPDFTVKQGYLTTKVNLNVGAEKQLRYTVKPTTYASAAFKANITYLHQGVEKTYEPASFTISVPSPFLITHEITPATTVIDGKATFDYGIKNNDGEHDMEASIVFGGLAPLIVGPMPKGLTQDGKDLRWNGDLGIGDEEEFSFSIAAARTGTYVIESNATMTVDGEEFLSPLRDSFTVAAKPLTGEIRTSPETIRGGQPYILRLFVSSKGGDTSFQDLQAELNISHGNVTERRTFALASVVKDSMPLLAELNLTAPDVASATTMNLRLGAAYTTRNGEPFALSVTKAVKVTPISDEYLITQTLNATNVTPGAVVSVIVKVKNQQDLPRAISVTDILPSGSVVTAGLRQNDLSLDKAEEREAYTYHVKIPESYHDRSFPVKTQVFETTTGLRFEKTAVIAVENPLPVVDDAPVGENATADATGGEEGEAWEPEEKKGIVRTVVDAIVGFFEGLFG